MDGEQALAVLRQETGRQTQSQLARVIGVSEGTVSRWLSAKSPPKRGLSVLIAWAEGLHNAEAPDTITSAILATGENVRRLAEIRGYAQFVLDQLHDTVKRQQMVVDSLSPWSDAEGRQLAMQMQKAADAEAALRRAVPPIDGTSDRSAAPTRKKKASGGK